MKTPTLPLMFGLAALLGCASPQDHAQQAQPPHRPRMTEAEVIAVAQRWVPLEETESYRAVYWEDGIWRLEVERHPGFRLLIRDKDGKLLGVTSCL